MSAALCCKLIGDLISREIVVALNILHAHGLELVRDRWASRDSPLLEQLCLLSLSRIHLTPHPLFIYRAPSQFIHVPFIIPMLFQLTYVALRVVILNSIILWNFIILFAGETIVPLGPARLPAPLSDFQTGLILSH